MNIYQLITPPAVEPVTVSEAKAHLRIDDTFTTDDSYINGLIVVARSMAEDYMNRLIIKQTWKMYMDQFPGDEIQIKKAILNTLTSIKYYDVDNVLQTISSSNYEVVNESEFMYPYVLPISTYDWPSTFEKEKAVVIEFIAGYADVNAVPEDIKLAIKVMVAEMYEIRQDTIKGSYFVTDLSKKILNKYRISEF